ncbi:MAG: hypothetical protein L6Q94_15270 [Calditrichia bacterium]|nr:hypothetical protein [Calditrichia bacterium]
MAVALSWRDKMIQHPGSAGYPAIFQVDIIFDRDDHAAQFPALPRRLPLLNCRLGKGAIPVCRMRVNLSKKITAKALRRRGFREFSPEIPPDLHKNQHCFLASLR